MIENHAQDETISAGHWFWDTTQSGGILVEHAVHFFDLIESFTSTQPVKIDTCSHCRSLGVQDRMLATVCYDDGLMVTQYHAFSRPKFFERATMRLWFDLAEVELEGWFPLSGRIRALTNAARGLPWRCSLTLPRYPVARCLVGMVEARQHSAFDSSRRLEQQGGKGRGRAETP